MLSGLFDLSVNSHDSTFKNYCNFLMCCNIWKDKWLSILWLFRMFFGILFISFPYVFFESFWLVPSQNSSWYSLWVSTQILFLFFCLLFVYSLHIVNPFLLEKIHDTNGIRRLGSSVLNFAKSLSLPQFSIFLVNNKGLRNLEMCGDRSHIRAEEVSSSVLYQLVSLSLSYP